MRANSNTLTTLGVIISAQTLSMATRHICARNVTRTVSLATFQQQTVLLAISRATFPFSRGTNAFSDAILVGPVSILSANNVKLHVAHVLQLLISVSLVKQEIYLERNALIRVLQGIQQTINVV